jgi:transcriptional regulator with XRE-family HTH domain
MFSQKAVRNLMPDEANSAGGENAPSYPGPAPSVSTVAERMGIDPPALSRLETGKMLNPTLATLHKWAEALGRKLEVDLSQA